MGQRSVVYGFIAVDPRFDAQNRATLRTFPFDSRYPFREVFSEIRPGYESNTVSFAASLKSLTEDWDEWERKFHRLLFSLHARMARVLLEDEIEGVAQNVTYVCDAGWDENVPPAQRPWSKWARDKTGAMGEEVKLTPVS